MQALQSGQLPRSDRICHLYSFCGGSIRQIQDAERKSDQELLGQLKSTIARLDNASLKVGQT